LAVERVAIESSWALDQAFFSGDKVSIAFKAGCAVRRRFGAGLARLLAQGADTANSIVSICFAYCQVADTHVLKQVESVIADGAICVAETYDARRWAILALAQCVVRVGANMALFALLFHCVQVSDYAA
jgi:hypothetical protein